MKHNTIQSKDDVVISINESTRDLTEPAHQRKVKVKGNHLSSHCKKKGSKKQFKRRNTAHQVGEGKIKQKDIERPTDKTLFLSREPPVLTLHMMRFEGIDKKTGHVEFDEILDIQAFMDPRSENNATRYHLVAVVEHIGGSIEQGQYIAYVRGSRMMYEQEPIPSSSSSWFFASDDTIRQASLDEVLKCKAYILFYERTKVYAMGKEEEKGVRTAETGNSLCTALRLEPTDSGCRDMTLHSQQEGYNVGGIPNLGFTCYINALVQCLLALDELWMLILGPHALVGSLGLELRNLFWKTRMGNDAEAMLKPQRLLECIRALNGRYRTPYQQDCHELLLDLLNWLNLEDMQKRPPDVGKDVPTVIDSIFQGQVSITWRYKCCQHTADKTETFYVLSLALPPGEHPTESGAFSLPLPPKECSTKSVASPQRSGKRAKTEFKGLSQWIWEDEKQKAVPISSIEKCLKYFFRNEVVAKRCDTCEPSPIRRKDGQTVANTNKSMPVDRGETGHDHRRKAVEKSNYRHSVVCEQIINTVNLDTTKQAELENTAHQVGEGQPTDKALFLTKLPPVSTLHVLRFENIYKKAGHVEFEESLNVETYLGPRSEKKDNSKYRLVGVIEHIGSSMEEGHYIAYVRGSCDHEKSSSSSWFCADDDSVRQASIDEVLKCEAYILFYERTKDTSMNKRKSSSSQQNGDGDSRLAKIMRYLPEDIWHHVHSQMPLNDAARAACLSSVFLCSWRCRPNLTLSMGTLASETHNCKSIYSDVIDSILRNHSGCVKMLKFDLKDLSCHSLDRWLRAAVEPGIEKLTVQPWQESYIFPLSLLPEGVRNSIRSLKIGFCTFHPTSQPSPMRSLTSLHLHTTNITGDELECLLYNSLVLERLVLIDCKDIVYLKISCKLRQLVYLKIVGCRLKVIESKAPKLLNFWLCSRTIP